MRYFGNWSIIILKQLESKAESAKDLVSIEEQEMMLAMSSDTNAGEESWAMPVLDGSSAESEESTGQNSYEITEEDLANVPVGISKQFKHILTKGGLWSSWLITIKINFNPNILTQV